jgi:hypothetical protein
VTVAAVDAVIAHMMFVTELNRLLALDVLAGVPAGAVDFGGDKERRDENKDCAEDCGSSQIVRAMTENLWHRRKKQSFA